MDLVLATNADPNRVCLAVSPSWKKVLESMHELWTTLDTSATRKSIKKSSLIAHLKRSNYTVNRAIISTRAYFDSEKMQYLTRTCKKLKTLEIRGPGNIGNSLLDALPDAHNLQYLTISEGCEIAFGHVRRALEIRRRSLVEIAFENVIGNATFGSSLPSGTLGVLKSIDLRSTNGANIDFVSFRLFIVHFRLANRQ